MTARILITTIFSFFVFLVSGQQTGQIETDRPDLTETPYTVPKKWLQVETGFNFEKDRRGLATFFYPTMLVKYGLANRFELRIIGEHVSFETPVPVPAGNKYQSGLTPLKLGGKYALFEEKGIRPKTSLLFHTTIPKAASKVFRQSKWAPDFILSMQHTISKNFGLGYNIGAEWEGELEGPTWIISLAPGFNFGKRWYAYAEIVNLLNDGEHPLNNIDGGIAYNISDNAKLDFSAGYGLNPHVYYGHYFAIGFSFRIPED